MGYNGTFRGEPESRVHPYIRGSAWITLQSDDQAGAYICCNTSRQIILYVQRT